MKLTVEVNLMDLFSDYETDDWGDSGVGSGIFDAIRVQI